MLPLLMLLPAGGGGLAPPPAHAAKEAPDMALLREAKALRYAQRWFEAAAAYRKFLEAFPQSSRIPEARFWLAATLEQDQRWDEASQAYTRFLTLHPDQRLLGKEARLNRVRCWGIRQGQLPEASSGLLEALQDPLPEVQVAAALQLAKTGDRSGVPALQRGLSMPAFADAASLALAAFKIKPDPAPSAQSARFLVIRIREEGKRDPVTIRLAISLARVIENYLSAEHVRLARTRGIPIENLSQRALDAPKGSEILSVEDAKSRVTVTVE